MISDSARKLGEALVKAQIITDAQLQAAIHATEQARSPSLIVGLFEAGALSFRVFEKFVTRSLGIRTTIASQHHLNQQAVNLLEKSFMEKHFVFPLNVRQTSNGDKILLLGMVDPLDDKAVHRVEKVTQHRVVAFLISLPDFKDAVKKAFPPGRAFEADGSPKELTLQRPSETKFVVIRPGGLEEELPAMSSSQTKVQPKVPMTKPIPLIGENATHLKEEILAVLGLTGSDAKALNKDSYVRETLRQDLEEVNIKTLEKLFGGLTLEEKFETLANALIHQQVIAKRDLWIWGAIALAFRAKAKKGAAT